MGTLERRARHRSELRALILDTARELFSTEGVEKVSMRRIADRIEYSPKTLYLHFRNKGEILYHLCEESFRKLDELTRAVAESGGTPVERVERFLRTYVEYGLTHPHDYRIAFLSDARDYPYQSHDELPPGSVVVAIHDRFYELLREGAACGVFRPMDVVLTTYVLWAGIHGLTVALIYDPEFHWAGRQQFIDATIGFLMDGLKPISL